MSAEPQPHAAEQLGPRLHGQTHRPARQRLDRAAQVAAGSRRSTPRPFRRRRRRRLPARRAIAAAASSGICCNSSTSRPASCRWRVESARLVRNRSASATADCTSSARSDCRASARSRSSCRSTSSRRCRIALLGLGQHRLPLGLRLLAGLPHQRPRARVKSASCSSVAAWSAAASLTGLPRRRPGPWRSPPGADRSPCAAGGRAAGAGCTTRTRKLTTSNRNVQTLKIMAQCPLISDRNGLASRMISAITRL